MDRLKKRDRLWYTENMNWDDMIEALERLKDENAQLRMNIELLENIADCYKQMAEKIEFLLIKLNKMDKFLQLLNTYCKEVGINFVYNEHEVDHEPTARWLVSKDFGFIKWLDKNKKIRWNTPLMTAIKDSFKPLFKEGQMGGRKGELIILMVLATSKKPLYDLYHYMLK